MEITKTDDFVKRFQKLPKNIHQLFFIQEKRFTENWKDPRLHIKKVQALRYAMSFRITNKYRAFFYFQQTDKAIFFEIDHRKDIYKKL